MANLENQLRASSLSFLTSDDLQILLKKSANSRYGQVKRLLAKGTLVQVRRGLYCLADKTAHPYELAQWVYGPSYISLESALSFHKLIPEEVYTVTSVATKRSKEFNTPLCVFSYLHLPRENFYLHVELIQENEHKFLMAKPWKAICDYIYCYKKNWKSLKPLEESLRIDIEKLPPITLAEISQFNDYYKNSRIHEFLKGIQNERRSHSTTIINL